MAIIQGMQVFIVTHPTYGGTRDPVYVGVEGTNLSGREFPLRYEKEGTVLENGKTYKFSFGIGGPAPDYRNAWDATGEGKNGMEIYPIDAQTFNLRPKVYLRKETSDSRASNDDAMVLINYGVTLTITEGDYLSYIARHQLRTEESPMYLGNEFGCKSYLFPN
jgi:hypothetical protein